jgi:hypothetical protein
MITVTEFFTHHTLDGKYHRLDGPALECVDGYVAYYRYGKPHRVSGPAFVHPEDGNCYFINGVQYDTREEYEAAGGTGWV